MHILYAHLYALLMCKISCFVIANMKDINANIMI